MSKAIQYMVNNNGVYTTQQFKLSTEDITIGTGILANTFYSCKSSDDTVYILCDSNTAPYSTTRAKIIKITSNGNVTVIRLDWMYSVYNAGAYAIKKIMLNRAEDKLIFICYDDSPKINIMSIEVSKLTTGDILIADVALIKTYASVSNIKFQLYRDLYIWGTDISYIYLYNQSSPYGQIGSRSSNISNIRTFSIDVNNQCWAICADGSGDRLSKVVYDGSQLVTTVFDFNGIVSFVYAKQSLIDKWGDLIIIINEGTTSKLIKINLTGTPAIINNIDLGGVRYNLNTDKDGTYFYSNNLNTWKMPANTAQGQAFSAIENHTIIRGTGMTTYDNDITGYMVSVNSSVGC